MSNADWWRRAQEALPGGVNSPVRAFRSVPGEPVFFRAARGARFTDEDGREYVDYCQSWGPLILGHADPDVEEAVAVAVREGCSFGAPSRREVLLAETQKLLSWRMAQNERELTHLRLRPEGVVSMA